MPPRFPVRLRWPAAHESAHYRVLVRDLIPGRLLKLESDEPELQVNVHPVQGDWPRWRVQVRRADGSWVDHLPYMDWPAAADGSSIELGWADDGDALHRIVVYDDSDQEIALKVATLEPRYRLDPARLDPTHAYRWRVQRWTEDAWLDLGPYRPLALEHPATVEIDEGTHGTGDDAGAPGEVLFLFTSDTEVHLRWMAEPDGRRGIQEQIFGRFEGEQVGIELQMRLLDEQGFKGTFFVDVLAEYQFGEGSLAPVFEAILSRGHDVQLHLHPSPHLRFASDERLQRLSTATYRDDPAMFRAALELAIERFEQRSGRLPVAYRAGAYRIFTSHFPILRELGIVLDSSVNPFKNCNVPPWLAAATQPEWIEGVLEVPVTWYLRDDGRQRAEQLAPVASPMGQASVAAGATATAAQAPITLCYIAHSYSFLGSTRTHDDERWAAWNERWEQAVGREERLISGYNVGAPLVELTHVDHRRIQTFMALLEQLGGQAHVAGISFAELAQRSEAWNEQREAAAFANPLVRYDARAGSARLTATRRYSTSYLARCESAPNQYAAEAR